MTRCRARAGVLLTLLAALVCIAAPASALSGSWSDRLADLPGAATLAGDGRGVTVAVLDTWVDASHPDFGGRVDKGVTCTAGRCSPGGITPDACDPHGTHVAGLVASARYGVAPQAKIFPIRVLTSRSGSCTADAADVALGIQYAVTHHIRLINVSLGSTFPLEDPQRVLPAAVTAATDAGDLVVVAAGNGKATAASTYGTNALTVAALGPSGAIASYSQRGAGVDIAAPGGDADGGSCDPTTCVVSTWQDSSYASDAGTSMAAPFVSGTAALLLSQDPRRSISDVRRTILSTAQPLAQAGAGRLDVLAAIRVHAPRGAVQATGADIGNGAAPLSPGANAAAPPPTGMAASVPPSVQSRAVGHPSSAGGVRIGPVQVLGLLVVGGVGLAFLAVSGTRASRR